MAEHAFDAAVALKAQGDDRYSGRYLGHIPQAYANMVGPFGGAIAATLLNAVLVHSSRQGEPVSVTVNYAAPIADAPFEVLARAVRTSRSTQHWLVELMQAGQVAATATAVLAVRPASTWAAGERKMPEAPAADSLPRMSGQGFPVWVGRYDFRFVRGALTMSGREQDDSESLIWVRDEPPRALDFLSLMALSDVFFPRVFLRRQQMSPAGTISITTHFHADADSLARQGERPLLLAARGGRFHRGFFDQGAELWGAEGELLASSSQMVYFRD